MELEFLKYNYPQIYENLVAGKMSFEDFMEYTNFVYDFGKKIGNFQGQSEAISRMTECMTNEKPSDQ